MNQMNFKRFFKDFPTEESCKLHFKTYRDRVGVVCKKCQCKEHYWLSTIFYYKCKSCGFRTSLKSGTVMENSKLPFSYWYMAFMMASSTKKSFSTLEVQRQIEHKFYQPIWEMMHKIRLVMGKRDAEYKLNDAIEMDEGFFITVPKQEKDEHGNKLPRDKKTRGKGNPRSQQVLVMVESKPNPDNRNKQRPSKSIKHIKMICIDDNTAKTITNESKKSLKPSAVINTDGAHHYTDLKLIFKGHHREAMGRFKGIKALPWVHKTISNAKRNLLGVHHSIGMHYLQNYLNEFCFKFNRRYNDLDLFDRLVNTAVGYTWN